MNTLRKFQHYMGNRKILLPIAMVLSVLSELAGLIPFILIWMIVRKLLEPGVIPADTDVPFTTAVSTTVANIAASGHVITYAIWAAALAVAGVLIYLASLMCSHLAAFRVESNLRREAMHRITKMPLGFFDLNTGGRIRKIIDDNAGITHSFLAHQLPDLAGTFIVPVAAIILIFIFDWQLGLACMVPIVIAAGVMVYSMNTKGQKFMASYMTLLEDMNTEAVEYVRGIPVVKVFQQTIFSFKNFYRSIMNYKKMASDYTNLWEKPVSCYMVILNSFVFFLAPLAILLSTGATVSSVLVNFFLFVLITPVFAQSIMKCMNLNEALGQAHEAITRLENLTAYEQFSVNTDPKVLRRFDIRFHNVSFSYPGIAQKAIDGISFTIPQGKRTALVGTSGGGKTTIARLIPRFWEVTDGSVLIGDINVKNIEPTELMRSISFVFQNPRLFKTTLLENITYGNPDASLDEVNHAVDMAQCREIIDRLPAGLNTRIGTEGTYLSGGEQQRIVLARAMLKNAPIVLLDEATAFADPENEHLIQRALAELTRGKTVLMIAHRLTSITDADEILVLDKGKIAERGTHAELLEKQGIYNKMWNEYRQSVCWTIGKEVCHD